MEYRELDHPLNVFAAMLRAAPGSGFLGYACIDRIANDLPRDEKRLRACFAEGQAGMADRLLARLPPPPARVLEMGAGLGGLSSRLQERGYEVYAQTSNAREADVLAGVLGDGGRVLYDSPQSLVDAELIRLPAFDAVVFQNSWHYHDALLLLEMLDLALRDGGHLVLADEFATDMAGVDTQRVMRESALRRLFRDRGYDNVQAEDVSAAVISAFPLFLSLFDRVREELPELAGISRTALTPLRQSLEADQQLFRDGERCHRIFSCTVPAASQRRSATLVGGWHSSPDQIAPLFEASFGERFDDDIWRWKYRQGGRHVCMVEDGGLVAHYGGAPRAIRYFSEARHALQICDVMVLPEKRGFYSRHGHFFRSASSFLDLYLGNGSEHLLGFGFPNRKAMRIARRLGLYEKTDDFVELRFRHREGGTGGWQAENWLPGSEAELRVCDPLWKAMAKDFSGAVIGVRDAQWLCYRYLQHPRRQAYRLLRIQSPDGVMQALAVVREHAGVLLLMDLVAPVSVMKLALETLSVLASTGQSELRCWVTQAHAEKLLLHDTEVHDAIHDQEIGIPCNVWSPGPPPGALRGAWWLMAGDMDFM